MHQTRTKLIIFAIPFLSLLLSSCVAQPTSSSSQASLTSDTTSTQTTSEGTSSEDITSEYTTSEVSSSEESSSEESSSSSSSEKQASSITIDSGDIPSSYGSGDFTINGVNFSYNDVASGYGYPMQWKKDSGTIYNNNALNDLVRITLNDVVQGEATLKVGTSSNNVKESISIKDDYFDIPAGYSYFKLTAGSGVFRCTSITIYYDGEVGPIEGGGGEDSSSSSSEVEPPFEYNGEILYDETSYSGSCEYIYNYDGNYYSGISEDLTGQSLLEALDRLIDQRKKSFSYDGMFTQFVYTDAADFENLGNGKITSFYSGNASTKGSMNREHTWPKSRGGDIIDNDPHMVRPTITNENSQRGNDFYNESPLSFDPAYFGVNKYRGIAARIMFYCAVQEWENGLKLVDKTNDSWSDSNRTMGKLSTLLKWNIQYPVDDTELLRNNCLYEKYNHCRNPFIDDRNYACKIWGNTNDETRMICGIH